MSGIQTLVDSTTTPGTTYICETTLGVLTSQPHWSIKAIDSAGSTKYPKDPTGKVSDLPVFEADDRATLTYAYN